MEIHHPVPFDKEKRQNTHEKRLAAMIYFERFSFLITLQRCKYRKPRHGHSVLIIYHSKVYSVFLHCKLHWWNNELCRPCCSPGKLVNPLSWRLLSAKKDVAGKKKLSILFADLSASSSMVLLCKCLLCSCGTFVFENFVSWTNSYQFGVSGRSPFMLRAVSLREACSTHKGEHNKLCIDLVTSWTFMCNTF